MIARRILTRGELSPAMHVAQSGDPRKQCRSTIRLDGVTYRCARSVHAGVHDALVQHHDCGAVRW